jgi:type II secretory pathway pseudopilin PulG
MRRSNNRTTQPARHHGMGLIEIMISLAITTALLTAVAVAWTSSADAVEDNDKYFRAAQSARVTLTQIMAEVRRCDSVVTVTNTQLRLNTKQYGDTINVMEWTYVPANTAYTNPVTGAATTTTDGRIMLVNYTTNKAYTLARNVTSCQFRSEMGSSDPDPSAPKNRHVMIAATIQSGIGQNVVTFTGSAAPRAYMIYKYE